MSRLRRALVAITMTSAAAGSGLLIAAASAAPAYAAAPAAPAASPAGHTYTITAQPTKHAKSGISPHITTCAFSTSTSCLPQTITCWINVPAPFISNYDIMAAANVHCDHPVDHIGLEEDLIANSQYVLDSDFGSVYGLANVDTAVQSLVCMGGTWTNHATGTIQFPDGYTPTFGSVYHNSDLNISVSACTPPPPPSDGGGGGGGCAVPAPSSSVHPAVRRPNLITCP